MEGSFLAGREGSLLGGGGLAWVGQVLENGAGSQGEMRFRERMSLGERALCKKRQVGGRPR